MSRRLIAIALGAGLGIAPMLATTSATAATTTAPAGTLAASRTVAAVTPTASRPDSIATSTRTSAHAATRTAARATAKPTINPPMLRPGMSGAVVTSLQQRLTRLGYWTGAPSGRYDHATAQGVMALQKAAGLGRDGVTGPATWRALERSTMPKARSTSGRVLEIDLKRQLLLLVRSGKVTAVINTSTGTAATPTPRGTYRVFRQINKWHTAPLGKLYRPKYFYRGYAVHGVADGSIPGRPASHGCARVSTKAMDMLWNGGLKVGDKVMVY